MRGISKSFGPVKANEAVDLAVAPGEILGLLGENGAGKTTLMNILFGAYQPDAGEIRVNGKPVTETVLRFDDRIRFGAAEARYESSEIGGSKPLPKPEEIKAHFAEAGSEDHRPRGDRGGDAPRKARGTRRIVPRDPLRKRRDQPGARIGEELLDGPECCQMRLDRGTVAASGCPGLGGGVQVAPAVIACGRGGKKAVDAMACHRTGSRISLLFLRGLPAGHG